MQTLENYIDTQVDKYDNLPFDLLLRRIRTDFLFVLQYIPKELNLNDDLAKLHSTVKPMLTDLGRNFPKFDIIENVTHNLWNSAKDRTDELNVHIVKLVMHVNVLQTMLFEADTCDIDLNELNSATKPFFELANKNFSSTHLA